MVVENENINLRKPILYELDEDPDDPNVPLPIDPNAPQTLMALTGDEPFLSGPVAPTHNNILSWILKDTSFDNYSVQIQIPKSVSDKNTKSTVVNSNSNSNSNSSTACTATTAHHPLNQNSDAQEYFQSVEQYHIKREENRHLAYKYDLQTAHIDQDGRLIDGREPIVRNGQGNANRNGNRNGNPQLAHVIPFWMQNHRVDPLELAEEDRNPNRNNAGAAGGFFGMIFGFGLQEQQEEDESIKRFIKYHEKDAARVIKAAVERYRAKGVAEDEFEVLHVKPLVGGRQNIIGRRVLVALFCVVAAFFCVILQSFNFFDHRHLEVDAKFDPLLYHLMNVKSLGEHLEDCQGLDRRVKLQKERRGWFGGVESYKYDCADRVLHIPANHILKEGNLTKGVLESYRNGVNASWFHECVLRDENETSCVLRRDFSVGKGNCNAQIDSDADGNTNTCSALKAPPAACFRGVHDGIIGDDDVENVLDFAQFMVSTGYDEAAITTKTHLLEDHIPFIVDKLRRLFRDVYGVSSIEPVAFQISVNFPIQFDLHTELQKEKIQHESNVNIHKKDQKRFSKGIYRAFNVTLYQKWKQQVESMNSYSRFSFQRPFRDACVLIADLEASKNFAFHTSVSLSDGAGEDFSGGTTMFVDNHPFNVDPKKKVQRGLLVDSSKGRVIISTGGQDNPRCRLPMREGVRVDLHVWWGCSPDDR